MGDKVTGVTYIKMNKLLDSGKIIKQFTCDINPSDNRNTLEKKLTELSINKLIEVLNYIKQDELSFVDQDESKKTYCKKINKEDLKEVTKILDKNSVHHEEFGIISKNDMIINEKTKLTIDELKSYYTNWLTKYMS